jgi:hypothetical protein
MNEQVSAQDAMIEELVGKYPNIFKEGAQVIMCGAGWNGILDKLCTSIECYVGEFNKRNPDCPISFKASQVKQKFGGLRFYGSLDNIELVRSYSLACGDNKILKDYDIAFHRVFGAISSTEFISTIVCESCGNKGSIDGNSFRMRCECESCRSSRIAKFDR